MLNMKKYSALEGLRVFAFFNVFWLHADYYRWFEYYQSAAWAVSFFFMLSGFLYGTKIWSYERLKLKNTISFFIKRVRKLWPLHCLTLLCLIPYSQIFIYNSWDENLVAWLKRFLPNIFLVQSWIKCGEIIYGFNGVAWYLSSLLFLIAMTVPLMVLIKRLNNWGSEKALIVVGIVVYILAWMWYNYVLKNNLETVYYLYVFPPARGFEYIVGMILGACFKIREYKKSVCYNIKSLGTWAMWVMGAVEFGIFIGLVKAFPFIEKQSEIWRSVGWIIPNCIILYIFARGEGKFSAILGCTLCRKIGSITFEAYLIHQVVNMYFSMAIGAVQGMPWLTKLKGCLFVLIMTFVFSEFAHEVFQKKRSITERMQ